jgi:hypothetical protein
MCQSQKPRLHERARELCRRLSGQSDSASPMARWRRAARRKRIPAVQARCCHTLNNSRVPAICSLRCQCLYATCRARGLLTREILACAQASTAARAALLKRKRLGQACCQSGDSIMLDFDVGEPKPWPLGKVHRGQRV